MARYHATADGNIPFTAEEEAEWDAMEAAAVAARFGNAKKAMLNAVNAECDRRMDILVAGYPDNEQKTFPQQAQEARAYASDPNSPTTMIDAIALNRGLDKASLVSRILAKADAFSAYSGRMIGYRQKLEDRIAAATNQTDLDAIDVLAGWPT